VRYDRVYSIGLEVYIRWNGFGDSMAIDQRQAIFWHTRRHWHHRMPPRASIIHSRLRGSSLNIRSRILCLCHLEAAPSSTKLANLCFHSSRRDLHFRTTLYTIYSLLRRSQTHKYMSSLLTWAKEKSKLPRHPPSSIRLLSHTCPISPSGQPGKQKFSSCMGQQILHSINIPVTSVHCAKPKSL
jgi:hypothetical protein